MIGSLDVGVPFLRASVARIYQKLAAGNADLPVDLVVSISGGIHNGCETSIRASKIRIGKGLDKEISLLDQSVAGPEITVSVQKSLFGVFASVQTERLDVSVDGAENDNEIQHSKLPCVVQFLEPPISVTLSHDVPLEEAVEPSHSTAGILLFVGFTLFFGLEYLRFGSSLPSNLQASSLKVSDNTAKIVDPSAFKELVQAQIIASPLAGKILTEQLPSGVTKIHGQLSEAEMPLWAALRQALDQLSTSHVLITDVKSVSDISNMPAIAAAQLNAKPYLALATGQILSIDDEIVRGWSIASISAEGFRVQQGNEILDISF